MPQKTGLGRGLGALIPGGDNTQIGNGVILVPVQKVLPNPRQPRNMIASRKPGRTNAFGS